MLPLHQRMRPRFAYVGVCVCVRVWVCVCAWVGVVLLMSDVTEHVLPNQSLNVSVIFKLKQ